jgi:DNA polymerase III sliding clamp (beta) subunit (PCNA family)
MKKDTLTLEKAKKTPAGGVLVGKREGQTMIYDDATVGGYFVGKLHKEGGIQGINKSTGQPIEVQSSEVIITAPAVADQTKREFQGEMLTNREILSKINVSGGGVSFEQGGDIPKELYYNGSSYNYGGNTMTDYEIMQKMNECGCEHEYKGGGSLDPYKTKIADLKRENKSTYPKVPTNKIFFNQVEVLPASVVSTADPYLDDETKLPTESVDLKSIVPTQKMVTIPNIESTKEVESYPILFKLNDRYYVLDGHHRITNAILKDEKEVMSYVYDYKAQNLDKFDNGGQLNLVEESKKGDHPARDFSNYTDVLDVQADGIAGGENGLAFDEGGFMADVYADGGATLSAEVFEWDKVPTNYRNISKVKKVPFTNNPMDKGLDSIIASFLSKDETRPNGMGINFDKNGITATDYHKLITLPYPNEKYEGIYDINRVKKIKADQPILIDGNYPNYEAIIPKSNVIKPYEIDVYKLLQYTKTAMNYANKTTRGISFKFGDNDRIGFNGSLLSEVLIASLKLGHEKLYAFITQPNRAMVLSPKKDYEVGSDEILLIMPIMLTSTFGTITGYGAEDVDYNRSIKAYFDFNDSEIHNADGSVAEFKMQYENNLSVDDKYLALLTKITSKNKSIPILDYAKVEDGKMTATDLETSLIIKDVNMPNGMYEIVNKAPNITMYPIEDFPKERVFKSNEVFVNHNGSKLVAFEFITFSEVFEFYLDKLLLSVGKDELRPVMTGICIKKTSDNELFLVTTNAHTLCKINITEYCDFDKDDRELEYILTTKYLKDFIKLADGSLHFKCNMSNIFIEADNLEYIARAIDGKYPNYEAVIPKQNNKMIVFDHAQMNKCLKSKEYQDLIAKYKGQKDIYFNLYNVGNKLFVAVNENKGYNKPSNTLEELELCNIDFNFREVEKTFSQSDSLFLSMNIMHTAKENQYFFVNSDLFKVMLDTITDTEVECYFTEPSKPLLFPIDAIDYKKTLPEEKTKQQPKKVAKAKKEAVNVEKEQLREAIETLLMLAETEENEEQRKEIYEALEILNMLKEDSYEYGGTLGKKLTFEPIRTPLN